MMFNSFAIDVNKKKGKKQIPEKTNSGICSGNRFLNMNYFVVSCSCSFHNSFAHGWVRMNSFY